MVAALVLSALVLADQSPATTTPADPQVDRIRAALEKPASKLTLPDVKPDFTVRIVERRPLQEIFETPPWQLPPVGWQPPAVGFDLLSLFTRAARAVAEAKRGHDLRMAREDVIRAIAEYCAAQPNSATIEICNGSPIVR